MAAVYLSGVLAGGPGGCHAYDVDGDDDDDDVERNKCNICNQGSLWTSILKPGVFLSGASGGVYALITGEIFMFVLNNQYFFWRFSLITFFNFLAFMLFCGKYIFYIKVYVLKSTFCTVLVHVFKTSGTPSRF